MTVNATTSNSAIRIDWLMTLSSGVMLVGLYLDGWAHRHLSNLESFFTPWHGVLYSGFFATMACLAYMLVRFRRPGQTWWQTIPPGYGLSLVGAAIFFAGGFADLIWHTLFGIEKQIEALLSPTHLVLAIGGTLIGAGPFRAAWQRVDQPANPHLPDLLPMLLALTFGWSVMTFFTQFAHPFVHLWAGGPMPDGIFNPQRMGLGALLIQSALMMGVILLTVRRWTLPFGSLTVVLTANAALMAMLELHLVFLLVGLGAGLGGDLLLRSLIPSALSPVRFRMFAFSLPACYYALYFLVLALTDGLWWSPPLWAGSIVLAGIVGWLLSYLPLPPGPHVHR